MRMYFYSYFFVITLHNPFHRFLSMLFCVDFDLYRPNWKQKQLLEERMNCSRSSALIIGLIRHGTLTGS